MSKIITSPVKRFPGTVTLKDPLYYPQVKAVRDALDAGKAIPDGSSQIDYNHAVMPGIIACAEEWNLTGVVKNPTPDTFPLTPSTSAGELFAWLMGEIVNLYQEADEIPNA